MGVEGFADIPARLASTVDQLSTEFEGIFECSYVEALVHEPLDSSRTRRSLRSSRS